MLRGSKAVLLVDGQRFGGLLQIVYLRPAFIAPVPFRPVVQPEVLRAVDRRALRPWQGLRRRSVQEGARTAVFRLLGALDDYAEPADEKQVWDVYAGNARVQR